MKKWYLFLLILPVLAFAAGEKSAAKPAVKPVEKPAEKVQDAKLTLLEAERSRTMVQLILLRKQYIQSDPTLAQMHRKILEMQRNLAVVLDSKKEIRALHEKLLRLDDEIRRQNTQKQK